MPINRSHWQILLGTTLLALGVTVIAGWWLRQPALVQIFSESSAMGFNTAFGFILLGIAIVVPTHSPPKPARLQMVLGYTLLILAGATLLEHIFDIDLGIDQAELHRWIKDGNPHPGRTSPNAAVALFIAGVVLVLTHRLHGAWGLRVVPALIALIALIGVLGVLGYLMHLDTLYRWYRFNRMALPTAFGIVVASLGLWANAQAAQWYRDIKWRREDERLNFIAASLFMLVALAAGLMVFIILQNGSQKILSDSLRETFNNRLDQFQHSVEHRGTLLTSLATRPNLIKMVHRLNMAPRDVESRATLHEIVESFRPLKFSAIAVYDMKGNRLSQLGEFAPRSALSLNLQQGNASVIWHKTPILRMGVPLRNRETQVGRIVAEQPLSVLVEFYSKIGIANSEETLVCGPQGDKIGCLPTRLNPNPLVIAHFNSEGKRFPISRALAGETGVAKVVRDYRRENVIATFGPIGNSGLGMVVKVDANEFYRPMRERLQVVLPLLLVFVIVGTLVLNAQIKPLAAKLVNSERAAREGTAQLEEKERRIRSIVENVGEGIVAIDQNGVIESFNPAAAAMFGYRADEVIGRNIKMLMPERMHAAHDQGMSRYLNTGEAHVIGKGSVELPGLRKDGSLLSLELAITEILHEGRRSFIGIMRDIADRKATQERLIYLAQHDTLTDLPNRALFFDRLTQAMTRARRSKQIVGLLYLDIDHFKQINDTRGHDVGDKLLCAFAQRLIACVRAVDTVARLGGDEFTIIAEGLNRTDDGEVVAQKLIRQMRSEFVLGDQRLTITASIGIAYFSGGELSAEAFVKNADTALYRAKEAGRDRYVMEGRG